MLQEPEGTPQPFYSPVHLLHRFTSRSAAVRLRIRADLPECPVRVYHRCVCPHPRRSGSRSCRHNLSLRLLRAHAGGTDICSLFAGMCTALPVFRGEIQCRLLGMAVEAFTPTGTVAGPDEAGELVCLRPFPCMPAGFWPLKGFGSDESVKNAEARFRQAYFYHFKDVWCMFVSSCNFECKLFRSR